MKRILSHFFWFLFFLTLPLFFLQLFPSLFGSSSLHSSTSYCYSSSNHSSPFITLILPPPPPPPPPPLLLPSAPILFSINWLLFPLHDYTTLFHLIHVPKKTNIFSSLFLRFSFFFSWTYYYFLQLCFGLISFCLFDNSTMGWMCFGVGF
jgi:hypothetical protein